MLSTGRIWSDAGTFTVWLCAFTTVELLKTSATAEGLVGLLLPHPIKYNAPATTGNALPASITKVRLSTVTLLSLGRDHSPRELGSKATLTGRDLACLCKGGQGASDTTGQI